jgi:hypothetical protein
LIDTLPLVWQVDVVPESWQLGRASAAGAETPATTAKLTINSADLRRFVICLSPFGLLGRYHNGHSLHALTSAHPSVTIRYDNGGGRTEGRTVGRRPLERIVTGSFDSHPGTAGHDLVAVVTNGHDAEIIVGHLIAGALLTTRALALRDHLRRGFFIGGAARFETHQAINEHTGTDRNGDVI